MELKSCTYATVTTLGDFGPWINKVVLDLPCVVRANDVNEHTFNIYCARHERAGEVLMRKEHGADHAAPSVGYVPVLAAYPCDENGQRLPKGTHVALETPEVRLTKEIEGGVLGSRYIENRLRVTQLVALPGEDGDDPTAGLVFDRSRGDICPALKGWHNAVQQTPVDGIALEYGYFEPSFEAADSALFNPFAPEDTPAVEKAPLIVYLHGAGEGKGATQGEGATRAYTGNRVTALSQKQIQRYFGGFAWVLVPQSPTFWMDNGVEQLGRSNQSIYSPVLKALHRRVCRRACRSHRYRPHRGRRSFQRRLYDAAPVRRLSRALRRGPSLLRPVVQRHGRGRGRARQDTAVVYAL